MALKVFESEQGVKFWGIASGSGSRLERAAVKYLILEYIQEQLREEGIHSIEINIGGLNKETIAYMHKRGMFKGKLPMLKEIAERKGNLDDLVIGIYGASHTPV